MEKWFVTAKKADFDAWSKKFNITPVTARIIRNRDIFSEEEVERYLKGTLLDLYPPELMYGMEDACAVLQEEICLKRAIRVIGDYDVDGISASHILTKGLQALGANVDTVIPHRMKDGYGLNDQLIEDAYREGIHTILTCDNGISAQGPIRKAKDYGMTVVVTDHHEVPYTEEDGKRVEILPEADVVVDPKQQKDTYPFPGICGAFVAFKLMELMFRRMELSIELRNVLMDEFIQVAAVATVCDVMDLLDENRILVKEGIKRMRQSPCRGLGALIKANGIEPAKLSSFHLGFVVGPCLNATGRLDSAKRALALLAAESDRDAAVLADELREMNDSRKAMTLNGVKEANILMEEKDMAGDKVLVLFLPDCHESLAGIIAGRIKEQYGRPCFVLTRAEEGVKGSGRSIEAYHMYDAMVECKELFTKFGGHKMAAGLSIKEENIPLLRETLNRNCTLSEEDFIPKIHIDVPMPLSYATPRFAEELQVLEPFGNGNLKPLFATKQVHIIRGRKLGANQSFAKFEVLQYGERYEMVFFGNLEKFHAFLEERFGKEKVGNLYGAGTDMEISVTYQVGINSFRGKTQVQLQLLNYC